MYIAIMSTHIFVDAIIVCMADARSGVGTDIVFDVSCRGMLARPTQGSGSMPSVDTSGRLGADQNREEAAWVDQGMVVTQGRQEPLEPGEQAQNQLVPPRDDLPPSLGEPVR